MTGEVTAQDIADGKQGDCLLCPVALAVGRMFEGYKVRVGLERVIIHQHNSVPPPVVLCVGESLAAWIDGFDNENPMAAIRLRISTWNIGDYKYRIDAI